MITLNFIGSRQGPHKFVAVITDDVGNKWDWMNLISTHTGCYQGSMGMLGPTHAEKVYDVEGYGDVPGHPKYNEGAQKFIIERFKMFPEEFTPHIVQSGRRIKP